MDAKILITLGRFDEAISLIQKRLTEKNQPIDDLLLIQGQLVDIEKSALQGTINEQEKKQMLAQVRKSLFTLINDSNKRVQEPENENPPDNDAENEATAEAIENTAQVNNKNTFEDKELPTLAQGSISLGRSSVYMIIAVICLLLIASFVLWQKQPALSKKSTKGAEIEVDQNNLIREMLTSNFPSLDNRYQSIYLRGANTGHAEVIKDAEKIIRTLSQTKDSKLLEEYKVYKYSALGACNKILSLISIRDEDKVKYSELTLKNLAAERQAIDSIRQIKDEKIKSKLEDWLEKGLVEERNQINEFIGSAVNYKAGGYVSKREVLDKLKELERKFLIEKHHFADYPIIQWARDSLK